MPGKPQVWLQPTVSPAWVPPPIRIFPDNSSIWIHLEGGFRELFPGGKAGRREDPVTDDWLPVAEAAAMKGVTLPGSPWSYQVGRAERQARPGRPSIPGAEPAQPGDLPALRGEAESRPGPGPLGGIAGGHDQYAIYANHAVVHRRQSPRGLLTPGALFFARFWLPPPVAWGPFLPAKKPPMAAGLSPTHHPTAPARGRPARPAAPAASAPVPPAARDQPAPRRWPGL